MRSVAARAVKLNIAESGAVLQAADEWISAQETLVAARQGCGDSDAEEEAVDIAGSRLVVAVMRWRSTL